MNLLSETICGSECMYKGDICTCGNSSYSYDDMLGQDIYCCILPEKNCTFEVFGTGSYNISCKNGTAKHIDEKCNSQCPKSQGKNHKWLFLTCLLCLLFDSLKKPEE